MSQKTLFNSLGIKNEEIKELNEDNIDWTFKEANMKENVHGFHVYPARMVPQVVNKLIRIFGNKAKQKIGHKDWGIYDPFCGSGTVLAEGRKLKFNVVGTDINPLAVLISRSKSYPLRVKELNSVWGYLRSNYLKKWNNKEYNKLKAPEMANIEFWFKLDVIHKLKVIREAILDLGKQQVDQNIINFFNVCFSYTVRKSSNNRQGEFKIYRIKKENLKKWNPDVFKIFDEKVKSNIRGMKEFYSFADVKNTSQVFYKNSKSFKPSIPIGLVVTSPPYGDHQTTVAYGQFSKYPALWVGLEKDKVLKIDKNGLGGIAPKIGLENLNYKKFVSPTLESTIQRVIEGDKQATKKKLEREREKAKNENREPNIKVKSDPRVYSVYSFFDEYFEVIRNLYSILLDGGYCCFVTGNRTVRTYRIPTHEITREFCEKVGFKHYKTLERSIPTKTMPWENSPTNVSGDKVETMATEHIIIVHKQKN